MEKCANCERTIGNLETPHLCEDKIVCRDCLPKVRRAEQPVERRGLAERVRTAVAALLVVGGLVCLKVGNDDLVRARSITLVLFKPETSLDKVSFGIEAVLGAFWVTWGILLWVVAALLSRK